MGGNTVLSSFGRSSKWASVTIEELRPFGQIHQGSTPCLNAFEHIPAHKHSHKSFVIAKVVAVKPPHLVWYGLLMLARVEHRDKKWDLRESINPHRPAKYSSNFTPEWIQTWPFIFASDRENLSDLIQPPCMTHMLPIIQDSDCTSCVHYITFISLWLSIQLFVINCLPSNIFCVLHTV